MAERKQQSKVTAFPTEDELTPAYIPTASESIAQQEVLRDFIDGRININKSYAQFNDRSLYDTIDDWTKRWNGYVPPADVLIDPDQSRMFLNFTRNQIVSYLAKIALQRPKAHIRAVSKKTGMPDEKLADVLEDLNEFSLNEENGEARFMEACIEVVTKGTVIVYEGYKKEMQKMKSIARYDATTGKIEYGEDENRVIFDNCFQQVVPLEDFYIANVYQPDVQKQPFVIWRQITTHTEAERSFGKYPNWQYVKPGAYTLEADPTTFYRNRVITDLTRTQVEIVRYYNRKRNIHRIMVNGVILYDGAIPFKDGRYPFAKGIFEPYEVNFFYGMAYPQKIMGEQDLMNTFWNMMADKTFGSLLPFGLSSDVDDLIEDEILQPNKIRKVGNINNWKFDTLPGVSQGEENMLQMALNFARENGGDMSGGINAATPKGGKVTARQALLKQQESTQRLGFSMNYMEDFEVDRTTLRLNHILQFYSIPKIEKISGKGGKEVEQMLFRDIRMDNVKLSNGRSGTRIIKMVDKMKNPDEKQKLQDEMSVSEAMGELSGQPTEVLALDVSTFMDYNYAVQVVRNSSFQRNQVLDQAQRAEFSGMLLQYAQLGVPIDVAAVLEWVGSAWEVDMDQFIKKNPQGAPQPGQPGVQPPQGGDKPPTSPGPSQSFQSKQAGSALDQLV